MEQLYNDALPCLQAVGPWWSDADRRLLFCHLMSIFHFDAEYLSSLPASVYTEFESTYRLSASDIEAEYGLFKKNHADETLNCPCIRKISFSFGKFNQKVCFLCPYSGLYKNSNLGSELRFLFHIMNNENRSLKDFLKDSDVKKSVKSLFKSYFPIYIDDVLIEAYPYALIVEQFLNFPAGSFLKYPNESRCKLTDNVHSVITPSLHYIRVWKYVEKHFINIFDKSIISLNKAIRRIEYETINTRPVSDRMLDRLFDFLNRKTKYKPLVPAAYHSVIFEPIIDDLFKSNITVDKSSYDTIDKLYEPIKSSDDFNFFVENSNLVGQTFLDENILNSHIESFKTTITTLPLTDEEIISPVLNDDVSPNESLFPVFQDIYPLKQFENVCVLYEQPKESTHSIFTAFVDQTKYFAMEPVELNEHKGLLLSNERMELLFLDISFHGAKFIRNLSEQNISIYSVNAYYTGCFLYSQGVYKLQIHDLSLAYTLAYDVFVKGPSDFLKSGFPNILFDYENIYNQCLDHMDEFKRGKLDTLESFYGILFYDGKDNPFTGLTKLYRVENGPKIDYQYQSSNQPAKNGLFISLKAKNPDNLVSPELLQTIYMEICISLNMHIPFYEQNIYLLGLSDDGLLFFLTGSPKRILKSRMILSSCCRRAFSYLSQAENMITLEEKTHKYEYTAHNN